MLNKFQEQDLMSGVDKLEDILSDIYNGEIKKTNMLPKLEDLYKRISKAVTDIKNIKPSLFSYPKVAKYTTGKFDSTIDISDGEE